MNKQITYIKDVIGQPYFGIKYTSDEIADIIDMWKSTFNISLASDKDMLLSFIDNRFKRDGDSYHITFINVMEFNQLKESFRKNGLKISELESALLKTVVDDIKFEGIGKAVKGDNEAHFIVVTSNILKSLREELNLDRKDLHITLGFDSKDVFGVSKGINSIFKEI